jgi:signal peptidase II
MSHHLPWSRGASLHKQRVLWLLLALAIIAVDRVTKLAVFNTFDVGEIRPITSFFSLCLTFNTGAAFSFLANAGGWQHFFFIGVSVLAVIVLTWLILRSAQPLFCAAAAMIIGGALGNLWDRFQYEKVIDFLLFHLGKWYYPAFNIADCAIVLGAVLLILDSARGQRKGN